MLDAPDFVLDALLAHKDRQSFVKGRATTSSSVPRAVTGPRCDHARFHAFLRAPRPPTHALSRPAPRLGVAAPGAGHTHVDGVEAAQAFEHRYHRRHLLDLYSEQSRQAADRMDGFLAQAR